MIQYGHILEASKGICDQNNTYEITINGFQVRKIIKCSTW